MIDAVMELHREAGLGAGEARLEADGRVFVMATLDEMPLEQYSAVQVANDEAGFNVEMTQAFQPIYDQQLGGEGEVDMQQAERITERLMLQAHRKGVVPDFLAAIMVEEGKEWTPETAAENRALFARLKGQSLLQVNAIMATMALAFFVSGLRSAGITRSSLKLDEKLAELGLEGAVTVRPKSDRDGAGVSEA